MARPKDIGTAAETAVVRHLRDNGFPHAERRALRGALDCGDVTGTPGVCWEVKGGAAAESASDGQVSLWLAETEKERANARADIGVLVLKRKGVGPASAGRWWAVFDGGESSNMRLFDGIWRWRFPIRLLLQDAVHLLHSAGYGDPL